MSDKGDLNAQPSYPVVVDPTPYATLTPEERKRLEGDAIQRILDLMPHQARPEMTKYLSRENVMTQSGSKVTIRGFAGSSNPEIARLLSVIASIRMAETEQHSQSVTNSASHNAVPDQQVPPEKRVFITVAIGGPDVTKAVAIVRPDYGLPILLLPANADAKTVKAGLRTAAQLSKDFGDRPAREFRAEVVVKDHDVPNAQQARLIAHIREAGTLKRIPGVGEGLLTLEVVTRRM